MKFKIGDKVIFNGGYPGTIVEIYSEGMIVVRNVSGITCIPACDAVLFAEAI